MGHVEERGRRRLGQRGAGSVTQVTDLGRTLVRGWGWPRPASSTYRLGEQAGDGLPELGSRNRAASSTTLPGFGLVLLIGLELYAITMSSMSRPSGHQGSPQDQRESRTQSGRAAVRRRRRERE